LSKKFHSLSVDQIDVLEIDCNRTRFGSYCVALCVQILTCNPAAYAQDHDIVSAGHSVNSAAHFESADEAFALRIILRLSSAAITATRGELSKPSALLKSLKIFDYSRQDCGGQT
jgi:hypothetical protein